MGKRVVNLMANGRLLNNCCFEKKLIFVTLRFGGSIVKKVLILSASLSVFCSANVFAALALMPIEEDVSGAYVGGNVGYEMGKNNTEFTHKGVNRMRALTGDKKNKYMASAYAGYGQTVANIPLYLGAQVGVGYTPADKNTYFYDDNVNVDRYTLETKSNYYLYADLLPGFVIGKHILIYGRLGAGANQYDMKISNRNNVKHEHDKRPSNSDTVAAMSWRYGLGLRYVFDNGFGLEANYIHESFTEEKLHNSDTEDDGAYAPSIYSIKPSRNEFNMGVNYTFGGPSSQNSGPDLLSD